MTSERRLALHRRNLLQLMAAGVGASCSGWMDALASHAADRPGAKGARSCILLWMDGGPSHLHTFDIKEKGDYRAIPTAVPGMFISEYLPKLARQTKHMTLLRGMSTPRATIDHPAGGHYIRTGFRRGSPVNYPTLGSLVAHHKSDLEGTLPNFIAVGEDSKSGRGLGLGGGYLGPKLNPISINPLKGLDNLAAPRPHEDTRQAIRLIHELDRSFSAGHRLPSIEAHRDGYARALRLMESPKAKAFNITDEPAAVRDAYGRNAFGDGCLLARRLVEVGVPFVEVRLPGWDTHSGAAGPVQKLSQILDPAFATLIEELDERGLLDSTLIVWAGEFGHAPPNGGSHWVDAWSTVLAGGGIKTGQIIGKTDAQGGSVVDRPINGPDFIATICMAMGIDPLAELTGPGNRPITITDKLAKPITEIINV